MSCLGIDFRIRAGDEIRNEGSANGKTIMRAGAGQGSPSEALVTWQLTPGEHPLAVMHSSANAK